MKLLCLNLCVFLCFSAAAHSENGLFIDIESFEFNKERLKDDPYTFTAREIISKKPTLRINLKREDENLSGEIWDLNRYLGIRLGFVELEYLKDEIPFYDDMSSMLLKNFIFSQDHHQASFDFEYLNADMFGLEIVYNNMLGTCRNRFEDTTLDLVDACLNNSNFSPKEDKSADLQLDKTAMFMAADFGVRFQLDQVTLAEDSLSVRASELQAQFGNLYISAKDLEMNCYKEIFTNKINDLQVVKNCLTRGAVKVPKLEIMDHELDLMGEVEVKKFNSNDQFIRFETGMMSYNFNQSHVSAETISAYCATAVLDIDFKYLDVPYGCLESSGFNMTGFTYKGGQLRSDMAELEFNVDDHQVELISPQIKVEMHTSDPILDHEKEEKLVVTVNNAQIKCDKNELENANLDSVLQGCFDSSQIEVGSVEVEHPLIDSSIVVTSISIDNDTLKFASPTGSYAMKEDINHFDNLRFECDLNASFNETVKESLKDTIGSWKKLLTNCLHNTVLNLDSLKTSFNGTHIGKTLLSMSKSFVIRSVTNLTFDTKAKELTDDKFSMFVTPRILQFYRPKLEIKGRVNFNPEVNQIMIQIDDVKTFFGLVSMTDIVMWILERVLDEEIVEVYQKSRMIRIQLPEDKVKTLPVDIQANPESEKKE